MAIIATLEEAFHLTSSKFKTVDLNAYQKFAMQKIVVERDNRHLKIPRFSRTDTASAILNSLNDHVVTSYP